MYPNEYDRRRAAVLEENVAKWGNPDIACVCGDAVRFAGMRGVFDVVSADVPCSGEGMMRKDADAAAQWSSALVADCARTQWRIVEALWQALRPGGTFVYSTCTFNRTENEDIVERMARELGAEGVAVASLASGRGTGIQPAQRRAASGFDYMGGHSSHSHRRGILHIVQPLMHGGIESEGLASGQVKTIRAPRHRLKSPRCTHALCRIDAHTYFRLCGKSPDKTFEIRTERSNRRNKLRL